MKVGFFLRHGEVVCAFMRRRRPSWGMMFFPLRFVTAEEKVFRCCDVADLLSGTTRTSLLRNHIQRVYDCFHIFEYLFLKKSTIFILLRPLSTVLRP